jgi:hypothetical protein
MAVGTFRKDRRDVCMHAVFRFCHGRGGVVVEWPWCGWGARRRLQGGNRRGEERRELWVLRRTFDHGDGYVRRVQTYGHMGGGGVEATKKDNARVKRRLFLDYVYFTLDVIGEEAVLLAHLYFARDVNGEEAITVLAYLYFARDVIGEAVPVFAYRYDTRSCDWRRWALHSRHPRTRSAFCTVWQPIPTTHHDSMVVRPVLRSPCSCFTVCFKRDGKIAAAMQETRIHLHAHTNRRACRGCRQTATRARSEPSNARNRFTGAGHKGKRGVVTAFAPVAQEEREKGTRNQHPLPRARDIHGLGEQNV